jgi:hypothetical protein
MAGEYNSVWAIDIGNNSLKALRLRSEGGVVEVIGFDNIQHGKVLTGSGIKPEVRFAAAGFWVRGGIFISD